MAFVVGTSILKSWFSCNDVGVMHEYPENLFADVHYLSTPIRVRARLVHLCDEVERLIVIRSTLIGKSS